MKANYTTPNLKSDATSVAMDLLKTITAEPEVQQNFIAAFYKDVEDDIAHLSDEQMRCFCATYIYELTCAADDESAEQYLLNELIHNKEAHRYLIDTYLAAEAEKIKATLAEKIDDGGIEAVEEVIEVSPEAAEVIEESLDNGAAAEEALENAINDPDVPKKRHSVTNVFKTCLTKIKNFFVNFGRSVKRFFQKIAKASKSGVKAVKVWFQKIAGASEKAWNAFKGFLHKVAHLSDEMPLLTAILTLAATYSACFLGGWVLGKITLMIIKIFNMNYLGGLIFQGVASLGGAVAVIFATEKPCNFAANKFIEWRARKAARDIAKDAAKEDPDDECIEGSFEGN